MKDWSLECVECTKLLVEIKSGAVGWCRSTQSKWLIVCPDCIENNRLAGSSKRILIEEKP